ncbi:MULTISPECIES: MFS transporter [Marinobacter]|uniref:MFS transporter n=1 Tax=Marinobacter TaxID=2742 RepID=UPI000948A350|nr:MULTISPECIES: MFS transporter [Marinobacter]MCZ4285910.1 MFS transporter [Marinobacter salarius]OLF85271.1 MFS transporter [Marinobacter sp. C18]|tara:strand:- start:5658 stop:6962 length:1305 start_codon:yes stop_codon:yes gene_type:complete
MLEILKNRTYRHLFLAQVVALLGTGLATVALSLLAFDLAGDKAGQVVGTAMAIKMVAYVFIAPIAAALAENIPRRVMLVSLDLVRAAVALALPFVTEVWEVYVLIAVLQSASAAFTPTFQSTIPDTLPNEDDYTRALSLSRLAYDLENLISPALAGMLLLVTSWQGLFSGTVVGFIASALLVVSVALPSGSAPEKRRGIYERSRRGFRIFMATPRLRGLIALNVVVSMAGSMVIVNTVVIVQGGFGLTDQHTAMAFAAFGAGSMLAALALPALLKRWKDRSVMLAGAWVLLGGLGAAWFADSLYMLMPVWALLGVGFSTVQTPIGRLLTQSSHGEDRPALFAAQFSLFHAGWLIAYPLAGWLGSSAGIQPTLMVLAVLGLVFLIAASRLWPADDPLVIAHSHHDLPRDHPHRTESGAEHSHRYVIDELHPRWPG